MFVSQPSYRFPMPIGLGAPDAQYWRAVDLSVRLPWFIATFEVQAEGVVVLQTVCVCWLKDLLDLLSNDPMVRPQSLQCMCPPTASQPHWQARQVLRVWRDRQTDGTQQLILEDFDGLYFSELTGRDEAECSAHRDLVLDLGGTTRERAARRAAMAPRRRNARAAP